MRWEKLAATEVCAHCSFQMKLHLSVLFQGGLAATMVNLCCEINKWEYDKNNVVSVKTSSL